MSSTENKSAPTKKIIRRKKIPSKYLDQLNFDLDIPEFTDKGVQKVVNCGFFKWTFSFNNMEIDHEYVLNKLKSRKIVRKKYGKAREKKRAAANNKWRKARQGFLLSAECEPDTGSAQGNPNLAVCRWKVNAMIVLNWKQPNTSRRKKEVERGWLFTNRVPWHGIKHYPPLACRHRNVLSVKLRVFRISSHSPTAFGPNFAEGPLKICLKLGAEQIYVERPFLEFHSPVLFEHVKKGKGSSKENPIPLENRFKPSLVKLAFRVIGRQSQFYVLNIPELLDFATTYGFHTLLQLIERRLVIKKCTKLPLDKKLNLAYKHRLNGLIVALSKQINKPTEIERHLKMKNLPIEFQTLLKRKMEAIHARVGDIESASKERRERKKERREKKGKRGAADKNKSIKNRLKKIKLAD